MIIKSFFTNFSIKSLGFLYHFIIIYIPGSGARAMPKNFGSGSSKRLLLHRLQLLLQLRNTAKDTSGISVV
jgi:hypothetical protein